MRCSGIIYYVANFMLKFCHTGYFPGFGSVWMLPGK